MDSTQFDLSSYFAEREERIDAPDERWEAFLDRRVSHQRSQDSFERPFHTFTPPNAVRDSPRQLLPPPRNETSPPASVVMEARSPGQKRKSVEPESNPADKRRRVADQSITEPFVVHPYQTSGTSASRSLRSPRPEAEPAQRLESPAVDDLRLAGPSTDAGTQDVSSRRRDQTPLPPSETSIDPITSFSRISGSTPPKRKPDTLIVAKRNQLQFQPLDDTLGAGKRASTKMKAKLEPARGHPAPARRRKPTPPASSQSSPMEDISEFPSDDLQPHSGAVPVEPPASGPSVGADIGQISHHSPSTPRRAKVVKLTTVPTVLEPNLEHAAEPGKSSRPLKVSSSPSSRAGSVTAPPTRGASSGKTRAATKGKGKKEKPPPMRPSDYAQSLQSKMEKIASRILEEEADPKRRRSKGIRFLRGKNVVYVGGDMTNASIGTQKKMNIIVEEGGNLLPVYDPEKTDIIITDAVERTTANALGIRSVSEIPDHIPTVTWHWMLAVLGKNLPQDEIDRKLDNAAVVHAAPFRNRKDPRNSLSSTARRLASTAIRRKAPETETHKLAPRASGSKTVAPQPIASSSSHDLAANTATSILGTGAPLSPPASPEHRVTSTESKQVVNDPLAEFVARARADKQTNDGWSSSEVDDDHSDDEPVPPPGVLTKRGWTCDQKQTDRQAACPNQDIIDKLTELMELHRAKPGDENHWRAFSYGKSLRALRNYPTRIRSYEEARKIRGVGEKTARKIQEILQTGELSRLKYERTADVQAARLFQGIYGVGRTTAYQWYAAGCRTLDDIHERKHGIKLSHVQEIGLRYYNDINSRMPRSETKAIFDLIKPLALSLDPKLFIEIMGSYRRGKSTCGDIDILISRPTDDGRDHSGLLPQLLRTLHDAHILTEDLAMPDAPDDLEVVYRGLCRLPGREAAKQRRIDILMVPWKYRGGALLYYTGDDIFNRAIRMKANHLGFSLNQRGLYQGVVRDPRDRRIKLHDGVLIASETEEEIFRRLGVPWQEPHERVRAPPE